MPPGDAGLYGYHRIFDAATLSYEATITNADGTWLDRGDARAIGENGCVAPAGEDCTTQAPNSGNISVLVELFQSDGAAPVFVNTPQSSDDCKRGGWRTRTTAAGDPFRNQGRCVSYVNAH